jgi:hypothetical protein
MEKERTGVKKEKKVIEWGDNNLEDDIPIYIQNKLRNSEIEERKKECQEQKLQLIKIEEEYKSSLDWRSKEKSQEDTKEQDTKVTRANKNSKRYFEGRMNLESWESLSLSAI